MERDEKPRENSPESAPTRKESLYTKAFRKLLRDRLGMLGLGIVVLYFFIGLGVWAGWFGAGWEETRPEGKTGVSAEHWFGTNRNGQDVCKRAVYSTKTAFEIGIVVALLSIAIGGTLGCLAGYFSGTWVDEIVIWIYTCLDCIPFYLFVAAVAFALSENPYAMHIAMIATFWTVSARVIRGEVIKLKHFEFVEAARAVGTPQFKIIFRHILPNTFHILLISATISFVAAIKSEVILSFLGLGVREGISWGLMIAEASSEIIAGNLNNFLAASGFLFVLVIGFNIFSDALQDALDPKKVS